MAKYLGPTMTLLDGEIRVLRQASLLLEAAEESGVVDGAGSVSFRRGREWSQRAAALREDSAFLDVFEHGAFLLNVCGPGPRRGIESSSVDSRLPTRVDEGTLVMVEGALEFVDAVAWARVRLLNHLEVLPLARSVDALVAAPQRLQRSRSWSRSWSWSCPGRRFSGDGCDPETFRRHTEAPHRTPRRGKRCRARH
ncbi:hypothetical protein OG948_37280 (plasmid) [Embleya sp. NBC_00888]|uniref:hypothetical protein n=1 Tax=Embleya sp. NBC_00888 TaxID=2975960 RepID=UPI003868E245|nr:hypothetical protein OG948_37280 [Embleya sp. NBC_00888]